MKRNKNNDKNKKTKQSAMGRGHNHKQQCGEEVTTENSRPFVIACGCCTPSFHYGLWLWHIPLPTVPAFFLPLYTVYYI